MGNGSTIMNSRAEREVRKGSALHVNPLTKQPVGMEAGNKQPTFKEE